ncbi:MAG: hypothetical protein WAU31_02785 [Candidatus Moraniibacteriota bacterium]
MDMMDNSDRTKKFLAKMYKHCEDLLSDFPERKKKVRWWHSLLKIKPRAVLCKEAMENCKRGLEALDKGDTREVVRILDKLIWWRNGEMRRFGADPTIIWTILDVSLFLKDLKRELLK